MPRFPSPLVRALLAEIQQVLVELNLVSRVSAPNYEGGSRATDEDIGGKRPPGGEEDYRRLGRTSAERIDYETSYRQKSAQYFLDQVNRAHRQYFQACEKTSEDEACDALVDSLESILASARASLRDHLRSPIGVGKEPEYGTPQWKRYIAESDEDSGTLARRFNVSRQYINRIRSSYRVAS